MLAHGLVQRMTRGAGSGRIAPAETPRNRRIFPGRPLHSRRSTVGEGGRYPEMPNGLVKELQELKPRDAASLPARDIRARKTPVRSALIRYEAVRRLTRVLILGALDVAGVFCAIWTALELKAVINGKSDLTQTFHQTQDFAPLAILVTLLLFARSGLYSDRAVRPGFTRVVASLVQVTFIVLVYAIVQGDTFSS